VISLAPPYLEDHPLSAVQDCLINIFPTTLGTKKIPSPAT